MLVREILARKGDLVVTIHPDVSLEQAAKQLARYKFGVLVASDDGTSIVGIISERDIVRKIAEVGAAALAIPVRSVMSRDVYTCEVTSRLNDVMRLMNEHRFRHVPVVADGLIAGMVSMTDVVSLRVTELETEAQQLQDYIGSA